MSIQKGCPFCGATPHRGPTPIQHDQLHGEPFQRYRVWCPKGHASIEAVNEEQAVAAWNRRAATSPAIGAEGPVAFIDPRHLALVKSNGKAVVVLRRNFNPNNVEYPSCNLPLYAHPVPPIQNEPTP